MAEERRKGAPDRRRSRATKAQQAGEQVQANEEARARNPNEAADELDESIRARQHEDRGEVF